MDHRTVARVIALGRVGIGLVLLAEPKRVTTNWVGQDDGASPGATALGMAVGARDAVLGAGVLGALRSGGARPWVIASAVADLADLAGVLRVRDRLPGSSVAFVGAVAGGSALAGALAARQRDW